MLKLQCDGQEEHLPSLALQTTPTRWPICASSTVLVFMRFNLMQLNHSKCELVGRGADGAPVKRPLSPLQAL